VTKSHALGRTPASHRRPAGAVGLHVVKALALLTAGVLAGWARGPTWALGPGDFMRGEQVYVRCSVCHSPATDRVRPRHCGLFGRLAGSVPGYSYSVAMEESHIVWNAKTLERFLNAPLEVVPGTTMTYDGNADP
jgi:cytochrome c